MVRNYKYLDKRKWECKTSRRRRRVWWKERQKKRESEWVCEWERERERESEAMETAICGRVPLSPNNVFNPAKPGTLSIWWNLCYYLYLLLLSIPEFIMNCTYRRGQVVKLQAMRSEKHFDDSISRWARKRWRLIGEAYNWENRTWPWIWIRLEV